MSGPEFEQVERIADAQERQAEALELIAGMMMLRYHYNDEAGVEFTAEAMEEEARFFARGGGL